MNMAHNDRYVIVKDRRYVGDKAIYTYYVFDDMYKVRAPLGYKSKVAAQQKAEQLNTEAEHHGPQ